MSDTDSLQATITVSPVNSDGQAFSLGAETGMQLELITSCVPVSTSLFRFYVLDQGVLVTSFEHPVR